MLEKLTPETLALIKSASMPSDINRLLDHCTALEQELKAAQEGGDERLALINELSIAAVGIDAPADASFLDVLKLLRTELKAAQEEIANHRCLPKKVRDDAINDFRAALVEAVRAKGWSTESVRSQVIQLIQTFELEK